MIIAKYKFDTSIYADLVPEFNSEFTSNLYTITDETDSTNSNIKIRTIESESLPTLMRFGQVWVESETGANTKSMSLLEILDMNTSNLTSMNSMFRYCSSLTSITCDWDTSNVTSMYAAFSGCSKLTSLDVSNFNTSKVTNMSYIFNYCSSLTSLDVSNWSTDKVNSMYSMFYYCSSLTSLDANNWNTDKVADMAYMFKGCSSLVSLDVSNWNTSNITNMIDMFKGCSSLTSLDVSNWNTSNITNMAGTFYDCSSLTSLDVSNWNTSNVTDINSIFFNCSSLTSLDVSNWNTSKVTNTYAVFASCRSLTSLDLSNWDTSNVTSMSFMFSECSLLTSLDVSNWNTSNVTTMKNIFNNCNRLSNIGAIYCSTTTINALSSALGTTIPRTVWVGDNINISTLTSYTNVTYKQQITSKAKVLLDEPLRKGDTIEVVDGKVKHVHKMGQVTLDENTLWNDIGNNIYTTQVDNMPTLHLNEFLCDNLKPLDRYQTLDENLNSYGVASIQDALRVRIPLVNSSTELRSYLHSNPLDAVYKLASTYSTPAQLMSNSGLTLSTSTNNYLHANTVIPTKVRLSAFEEKVNILANTRYYVRFTADKASTVNVSLGGSTTESVTTKVGCNEVIITTPGTLTNSKLVIDCNGDNVNISKAMVVKNESGLDRASYFKDIESAYESRKCEQLISSQIEEFTLVSPTTSYMQQNISISKKLKANTTYTVIVTGELNGSSTNQFHSVVLGGTDANTWGCRLMPGYIVRKNGNTWIYRITTPSDFKSSFNDGLSIGVIAESDGADKINTTIKDIRLYEGDFVYNYPKEWHTGVKYLVNAKITGKNKFNKNNTVAKYLAPHYTNDGQATNLLRLVYPDKENLTSERIKIKPNTTYTFNISGHTIPEGDIDWVGWGYFNDDTMLSIDGRHVLYDTLPVTFTTPSNANYLMISARFLQQESAKVQLEEGAEATDYEPYHEETKQLLLNSPLYKGDSIEYINGCINHVHRMKEVILDSDNEYWWLFDGQTNPGLKTFGWNPYEAITKGSIFSEVISNRFTYTDGGYNKPSENISSYADANAGSIYVSIKTDRLSEPTENGFTQWLSEHPLRVIYRLDKPYLEPLGPTELKYSANTNYTLSTDTNVHPTKLSLTGLTDRYIGLKPSTRYLVRFTADKAGSLTICLGGTMPTIDVVKGVNTVFIDTPNTMGNYDIEFIGNGINVSRVFVSENVTAIGGYYKGMKNSFDDGYVSESGENHGKYKVEVKVIGKNLLDVSKLIYENDNIACTSVENGIRIQSKTDGPYRSVGVVISVKPNTTYYMRYDKNVTSGNALVDLYSYDNGWNYMRGIEPSQRFNSGNNDKLRVNFYCTDVTSSSGDVTFTNIQIEEGTEATAYEPYREEVKTVYLNSPLLENDRIEYHDGKLCHYHASKKMIFSGASSEGWIIERSSDTTIEFNIMSSNINGISAAGGISNFACNVDYGSMDRVFINSNTLYVTVQKWRLTDNTVDAFKAWLVNNPLEIVYPIANPYYEPLSDEQLLFTSVPKATICTSITNPYPKTVYFKGFEEELLLVANKEYQVKFYSDTTTTVNIDLGGTVQSENIVKGWNKVVITAPSTLTHSRIIISAQGSAKISKVIVTDNVENVGYFKGLSNTYDSELVTDRNDANYGKYKVNVKLTGKNLFDSSKITTGNALNNNTGAIYSADNRDISDYIPISCDRTYTLSGANISARCFYNSDGIYVGYTTANTFTTPSDAKYMRFAYDNTLEHSSIQLEEGSTSTNYEPYYESVDTVYLNSPLLKEDTIEYIDGKLYHVHRWGEIEFDGSDDEEWNFVKTVSDYSSFTVPKPSNSLNSTTSLICNTINGMESAYNLSLQKEGMSFDGNGKIYIQFKNSKLSEISVNGFKQWLQANPTIITHKLKTPWKEELETGGLFVKSSATITKPTIHTVSTIPVKSMDLVNHQEELVLASDTVYTIQFNAKTTINEAISIELGGGTPYNKTVTNGLNRFEVTTPATLSHSKLIMSGQGFTVSDVMVTKKIADINLDYFKGLSSTGEYDETTGKYVVETVMHGKNIIDVNKIQWNTINGNTTSYVYVGDTTNKVLSITLKSGKSHLDVFFGLSKEPVDGGKWIIASNGTSSNTQLSVVGSSEYKYIRFYSSTKTIQDLLDTYDIQLEYGDTATTYEAPDISNTKVYLNSPLLEGDELVVRGKNIVHVHNSAQCTLTKDDVPSYPGPVTWYLNSTSAAILTSKETLRNSESPTAIYSCDKFITTSKDLWTNTYNYEAIALVSDIWGFCIRVSNSKTGLSANSTESEICDAFKAWLDANPTTVVYKLLNPWEEVVSTSQVYLQANKATASRNIVVNSSVPAKEITFKPFIEEDLVLKPNTRYAVRFDAKITESLTNPVTQNTSIKLGGSTISAYVKNGKNTVYITTSSSLTDNRLIIDGIRGDILNVVVSEWADIVNDCQVEYFEGLKSVCETADNTVELTICGQNLANPAYYGNFDNYTDIYLNYYYAAPLFIGKGKTALIRSNLKESAKGSKSMFLITNNSRFNGRGEWVGIVHTNSDSTETIKTINADDNGYIYYVASWLTKAITYIDQLTITTDTTVTNHIPYTEETVKVQLTSPLLKGDKLVVQDGKMYHYHKMGKVVLNGSEDEEWEFSTTWDRAVYKNIVVADDGYNIISNNNCPSVFVWNASFRIGIKGMSDRNIISLDEFKQWLSEHPTAVIYELAEPYYEEVHTIESPRRNDRMILPVHKDSIATINSVIPTEKVVFKAFEEELDMLEANTRYRVRTSTFKTVNNGVISLDTVSANYLSNAIASSNWIETPASITNTKLTIDGFCTGLLKNVQIVKNVIPNGLEDVKFKMTSIGSSVKLVSRGKNLIDFSKYFGGNNTNYIVNGNSITITAINSGTHKTAMFSIDHLKPNSKYCLSVGSVLNGSDWRLTIYQVNKGQSIKSIISNSGNGYTVFNTPDDTSDLVLILYVNTLNSVEAGASVTYNNIMIEECTSDDQTTPSSYVAPEKQELTIPLSDTLKSLPNGVCDRIVKLYGEWYVERNVGEVVLDGSEDETWTKYTSTITLNKYYVNENLLFVHNYISSVKTEIITYNSVDRFCFKRNDIESVAVFREWLSNNPITIQLPLATPVYEKLTVKPTMKSWSGYTTVQVDSIAPSTVTMKNHSLNALIKPNTQYTIQLGMVNASPVTVNLGGKKAVVGGYTPTVITTDATVNDQIVLTSNDSKGKYVQNVTLVEGDKSSNMPSYFTKMVPNSNTTKVKALGKNLAIFDNMYYQTGYVIKPQDKSPIDYVKNGDIIEIAYRRAGGLLNSGAVCLDIWMNKDETIAISGYVKNALNVRTYYNGGFLSRLIELTNITDSNDWIDINSAFTAPISGLYTFRLWFANTDPIQVRNLQVEYGTVATEYEEPVYEVSEIVTPSSPILEGDKVYRNLSGDIVHYHKSKMVVFDGSDDEEWSDIWNDGYPSDTTFIAKIKLPENRVVHQGYCDKFNKNSAVTDIDIEYITTGAGTANDIGIRIAKIRLETPDLAGFRQWLSENPVTLVYELAEPYEETIGTSTLALEEDSSMLAIVDPTTEQSTLLVDQALPVTVSFANYKLALPSLLPGRSYLLQFYSNYPSIGRFSLGGADPVPVSIVEGKNRVILSTPNPVTAYNLVIDGDGFEIVDLVVTDVNTREFTYFNGMKSTYEGNGVIDIHSVSRNRVNWAGDAAIMESVDKNGNILFELYGRVLRVIPSNDGVRSIKTTMYDRELAKLTINPYDFNINLSNIERRNINVLTMSIRIYRDEAHILDTVSLIDIDTNMVLANLQHGILYHINFLADQNIGLSYADGECYVDIAATQIELGNDATTTVTPYSKKLEMILDSPLLNNDKLYKIANGKVAHLHMSGMIDIKDYLDNMQVVNNNIDKPVATIVIDNMQYNNNINDLIVERINTVNYADLVEGISGVCISAVDNVLYISNSNMTSLDDYKAWLSTSVKVVYPLLTPYNTELNLSNNLHIEVPNNGIIYTCNTAIAPNIAFKSLTEKLNLLPNTTYSVRFTLDQDLRPISINLGGTTKLVMGMSGDNQVQITTPETLTSGMIIFDGDGTNISKVIVSPVSELPATTRYFSGVHSSFEDNMNEDGKYELIMRTIGKNKVNPLLFGSVDGDIDCRPSVTGVTVTSVNKPVMSRVELVPNEDYVFKCQVDAEIGAIVAIAVEGTDGKPNLTNLLTRQEVEGKGTVILNFSTTNTINAVYVILAPKSVKVRPTTITVTEMQLEMGNQATEYEMYTEDVDKLYLTTPLCEGDRIYYEAGQVIHQHRMGKVTFDHMSNIDDMVSRVEWMSTNTFAVLLDAPTDARNDYSAESVVKPNWYCDNFLVHTPSELKGTNIEGISPVDQGEFVWRLVVNNDKLVTADEIGMAEYLANNPVTVVYELSQPYNEVVYDQILALTTEPGTTIHFESAVPVNSILEYSVGVKTIAGVQAEQDQTALETSYQMALMEIATGVNLSDYM